VAPPPPWPSRKANNLVVGAFAVVLAVLILLWYTAPQWDGAFRPKNPPPGPSYVSVNITEWAFAGPADCWQESVFSNGGVVPLNGTLHTSVALPYPDGLTGPNCTAQSVQVLTHDFVYANSNAPITVPPGGAARLYVNVTVPGAVYTGPLMMLVTAVSP
jgi:hypothetical protein